MVSTREPWSYVRTDSFRPFQIRMTDGRNYDIRHPEMIRVGQNSLIIFTFASDHPEIYDHWEPVWLTLIESVAFLEPQSA